VTGTLFGSAIFAKKVVEGTNTWSLDLSQANEWETKQLQRKSDCQTPKNSTGSFVAPITTHVKSE